VFDKNVLVAQAKKLKLCNNKNSTTSNRGRKMKKLIPYEIDGKQQSTAYLQQIIQTYLSDIEADLVGDLSYYSENSQYTPDSLKVLAITPLDDGRYSMSYGFKWTIFNGCLDINADEYTTERVSFKSNLRGWNLILSTPSVQPPLRNCNFE